MNRSTTTSDAHTTSGSRRTSLETGVGHTDRRSRIGAWAGRRALYTALGGLREGQVTLVEPEGERVFGKPSDALTRGARIVVHDPRFYSSLAQGIVGAAEAFMAGHWSCDDLPLLVRILLRNDDARGSFDGPLVKLSEPLRRGIELLRRANTRVGSRGNIAAHYDLGNDFFELFLDPTMTYSAGIFERPESSMEDASRAKYDRLCRKLGLSKDDRLLEIGTGWGGLAIHAARHYGCHVTTTTISEEQHALARERVEAAGLSDRVTLLLEDYRDLTGQFDKLISIEMIEAVGHEYLEGYFQVCSDRLEPWGLMALQVIAIADGEYERAKRTVDFVRKHIFPGGCLPSVEVMSRCAALTGELSFVHLEDLTPHYAETLRRWRQRFMENRAAIADLGYSEAFLRMWEFYLGYCEGGFDERRSRSVQLVLAKPDWRRALPEVGLI